MEKNSEDLGWNLGNKNFKILKINKTSKTDFILWNDRNRRPKRINLEIERETSQ